MIDIAVPRDIDPAVREIEGIHLFDMDDLEHVVQRNALGRQAAADAAEKIVAGGGAGLPSQIDGGAGCAHHRRPATTSR